ncbi:MAG: hypothetical protein ABIZ80_08160 [Bryobacteraceae bacterium]
MSPSQNVRGVGVEPTAAVVPAQAEQQRSTTLRHICGQLLRFSMTALEGVTL